MYPYSDMDSKEKSLLLDKLFALRQADKEERDQLLSKLDRMTEQLLSLNESTLAQTKVVDDLKKTIDDLKKTIADRDVLIEKLQKENAALKERKKLSDKSRISDSREADK